MKASLIPALVLSILVSACFSRPIAAQNFTPLYTFTNGVHGSAPKGITLAGDTLFGVTFHGVPGSIVYSVKTNGTAFTVLHTFAGNEGSQPYGAPVLSGNTLYGTTVQGGVALDSAGGGTVFKVDTDGSNFSVLHTFSSASPSSSWVNTDGFGAWAGLVLSGNKLYGTTQRGGNFGFGTIYSINTDGSGFAVLHSFANGGQQDSSAKLVVSGNKLFGTTRYGGTNGRGTIFSINTDGSNFSILHSFSFSSDGYYPIGGLILSGNTLYGTTAIGAGVYGTIYKINTDGTGFGVVYGFTGPPAGSRSAETELTMVGDVLYGCTWGGGVDNLGTLFSVKTNGTGYTLLYSFSQTDTNGYNPQAQLSISGNYLYGTASYGGGANRVGTVFSYKYSNCDPAGLSIQTYSGLNITGSIGCTYQIEWRPDNNQNTLWNPLTTVTLTNSPFFFMDPTPIQGNRYYRAVAQ